MDHAKTKFHSEKENQSENLNGFFYIYIYKR